MLTLRINGGGGLLNPNAAVVAQDASCAAVTTALINSATGVSPSHAPYGGVSCSSDPLVASGFVTLTSDYGSNTIVVGFDSFTLDSSTVLPTSWQDAIAAQNVAISTLQTQLQTVETLVSSNSVDDGTVQAAGVVFAAALAACCVIWGAKQIMRIFDTGPGEQ